MKTRITYYDILGIEPDASMGEIKKAYKIMAKADHPDINAGNKSANKRMALLNKAYQTLIDPVARQEYGKQLAENAPQGGTRSYEWGQDQDQADMQKKGSWWPVVAIILIVLIVPIISQFNTSSSKSNKTVVPTLSVQNNPPLLSPTPLPSNYISCAPNSYLSNGVFCTCIPGFERNHNTGKCDKSVN